VPAMARPRRPLSMRASQASWSIRFSLRMMISGAPSSSSRFTPVVAVDDAPVQVIEVGRRRSVHRRAGPWAADPAGSRAAPTGSSTRTRAGSAETASIKRSRLIAFLRRCPLVVRTSISDAIRSPTGRQRSGRVDSDSSCLPSYLLPQWGFVVPFAMTSSSQFRPPGPPSLDSQQYAADMRRSNNSARLSGQRGHQTRARSHCSGRTAPGPRRLPAIGTRIAQIIADARGNTLKKTQGCMPC